MSLAAFTAAVKELEAVKAKLSRAERAVQDGYEKALEALYKGVFPRRKFSSARCFDELPERARAVLDEWRSKASALSAENSGVVQAMESKLKALAVDAPVPKADEWLRWTEVSSTSYNSQGYGACKYAKDHAQQDADKAVYHGVEAEVREENPHTTKRWGVRHATYVVYVKTTPDGLTLLGYKSGVPLVEWVRMCWARHTNPRVYNPFLPSDFEDKHGLDYFGGYKDAAKKPASAV